MNTPSSVCTAVIGFEHADFNSVNDLYEMPLLLKLLKKISTLNFMLEY